MGRSAPERKSVLRRLLTAPGQKSRAAPVVSLARAALCLLLSGCATVPSAIREPPPSDVQLVEVLRDGPSAYEGTRVRWGGTVMSVTVREGDTWLEILQRRLDSEGEPRRGGPSDGRFLAVRAGTDTSAYRLGQDVTVAGVVEDAFEGSIGRRSYTFPVVRVKASYIWKPDYYAYHPHGYYRGYHLYRHPAFPHVFGFHHHHHPFGW